MIPEVLDREVLEAGAILVPAAALWLSYPCRSRVAAAACGVILAAGGALVALTPAEARPGAALAAIGSLLATVVVWLLCRRREADHRAAFSRLETVRIQRLQI